MALIDRIVQTKGGIVHIRSARASDAAAYLVYLRSVAQESDFLTFEIDEVDLFVDEDLFLEQLALEPNALALIALFEGRIIGSLTFRCPKRPKLSRSGEFGLSVCKAWWGKGVGSALLKTLIEWAPQAAIGKIHLQVRADNQRAIRLYSHYGFVQEAVIRHQIQIEHAYYDLLWMGLKIGDDGPSEKPVYFEEMPRGRSQQSVHIRQARPEDAPSILACFEEIASQTDYLSMGDEVAVTSSTELQLILSALTNKSPNFYLVACAADTVVGTLSFTRGQRKRTQHAGDFMLAVRSDYSGRGIGRALIHQLIAYGVSSGIHKINLQVRTENDRAVQLYHSCAFTMEGRISRTVFSHGAFHDSYAMGLIL